MNKELIMEKLQLLANKLNVTIEHLWAVLVKQAYISGLNYVICISLAIIAWVVSVLWFLSVRKKTLKKYEIDSVWDLNNGENEGIHLALLGILICIFSICLCFCVGCIGNVITAFGNPEYWALREIGRFLH